VEHLEHVNARLFELVKKQAVKGRCPEEKGLLLLMPSSD
jgi:hypothetical protein